MKITVKDLIDYLSRFKPDDELYWLCDELSEYLPFDECSLGCVAVRTELEETNRKEIKNVKYLKRTDKSRREFKKWLDKNVRIRKEIL